MVTRQLQVERGTGKVRRPFGIIYMVHLWLVGKRVVDFLLVLNTLPFLSFFFILLARRRVLPLVTYVANASVTDDDKRQTDVLPRCHAINHSVAVTGNNSVTSR